MLSTLLAVVLSLSPARQEPATEVFVLTGRETMRGQVVRIDGDRAVLAVQVLGGSATIRRPLREFTAETQYRIHLLAAPPQTFAEHLAMAKIAIDLAVPTQAGEQAGLARELAKADRTGAETVVLDTWAAATLTTLFHAAVRADDIVAARHYLKLIATRVPEQFTEDQLGALFDELAAADPHRQEPTRAAVAPKGPPRPPSEFDKQRAALLRRIQQADERIKTGLRASHSTTQAAQSFELAIAGYQAAWQQLQTILKEADIDAGDQEAASKLVQRVKDGAVDAALHAGNALAVQGDYRGAFGWANRALVLEPDQAEARELIRTIQIAQAAGSAWGRWGRQ